MENNKGITLITLTIMIVVILILAAVGANHNSDSIKYAKLTKLTTEFEIINTQISILNQNKNYQTEYVDYGLDSTKNAELISKINTLLTSLRTKGIITTDSPNQQISHWILVEDENKSNKNS